MKVNITNNAKVEASGESEVGKAMNTILAAMRDDEEYLWSWHCNLQMAFADSLPNSNKSMGMAAQGSLRFLGWLSANSDSSKDALEALRLKVEKQEKERLQS